MSSRRTEVRIAGFGGQGVVLAGVLLGRSALEDGMCAVQNQSYGAEARGGAARSEVIVADGPVVYPEVIAPDIMTAMSQAALDRYVSDLSPRGTLIVDGGLVSRLPADAPYRILQADFTQIATAELGRAIVANMVMLGYLVAVTGVVSAQALHRGVPGGVPVGTEDLNIRALERGAQLAAASSAG
jgi:2-oxoglutarate ferredoxin oxidoreductase subunit gamma